MEPSAADNYIFSISEYGFLSIQTNDPENAGLHNLRLFVTVKRYLKETESEYIDFRVHIVENESNIVVEIDTDIKEEVFYAMDSSTTVYSGIEYTIGDIGIELPIVESSFKLCTDSNFETVPVKNKLPYAFNVITDTELCQVKVSL